MQLTAGQRASTLQELEDLLRLKHEQRVVCVVAHSNTDPSHLKRLVLGTQEAAARDTDCAAGRGDQVQQEAGSIGEQRVGSC